MARKLPLWCFVATFALLRVASADPLTDSFVGSTKRPAHKSTTTKKPASKPASKPESKARRRSPPSSAHARGTPSNADELANDRGSSSDEASSPPRRAPPPKKRKPGTGDDEDDAGNDDGDEGEGEEDDGDADAARASRPVISPRLFSFQLGGALTGRNFKFDVPLQHESSFPRFGFLLGVETYPLMLLDEGWYQRLGLGASYSAEVIGQASIAQSGGASTNTPVKQARWVVELRYALSLGSRVVLTPALGLDGSSFTLSTKMPVMASACTATQTVPCLPDTQSLLFGMGGHLRIAATSELGISLDGTYLQALVVKNRPANEIGYEAGTSANGFSVAAGATYLFTDWLAVHGEIPITRLTYTFHNPPPTPYKTATELYYGATAAIVVMTK